MRRSIRRFGCVVVLVLALAVAQRASQSAHYRYHDGVPLNDLQATPGKVRTADSHDPAVCGGGSTKAYRHTTQGMKRKACLSYGLADCPHQGKLELDHLIPLELGGADEISNLWPQPAEPKPGFHEKDRLENELHGEVCSGKESLADAQTEISKDWYAAYLKRWPTN